MEPRGVGGRDQRFLLLRVIYLVAIFSAIFSATYLIGRLLPQEYMDYMRLVYAILILAAGFVISRQMAKALIRISEPRLGIRALSIGNVVAILGYSATILAFLAFLGATPEALLAGGVAGGLILGIAAQPVLANFFAGIILLASGMVRPGDEVRIIGGIPYQWSFLPAYKYFSPDYIYPGYRGVVKEVTLFYTIITMEEGRDLYVPNILIMNNSAVLKYGSDNSEYQFSVRYEFRYTCDPGEVLSRLREALSDLNVIDIYLNEQSDKEFYIVKVDFRASQREWRRIKSEILKRMINLHRELSLNGKCIQQTTPSQ